MNAIPRFTPGRFTALWVILRGLAKLGEGVTEDELLSFARRSGLRAGGLPITDGFTLAQFGGFVQSVNARITLTGLGREALVRAHDDEPTQEVLRLFASVLFLRHPPAWVAYWQGSPKDLDLVMPDGSRDILRDAGLLDDADDDIEAWSLWNALKSVPPIENAMAIRAEIGAAGEELALAHERERLEREGYLSLAQRVRWVAQESASYGFDILSFAGRSYPSDRPETPLAVEVKASAITPRSSLDFFLTRHEWETAQTFPGRYIIQYWGGVRPGSPPLSAVPPISIKAQTLKAHLPGGTSCGEDCRWESVRLCIPHSS
jgi:hypothetical protein